MLGIFGAHLLLLRKELVDQQPRRSSSGEAYSLRPRAGEITLAGIDQSLHELYGGNVTFRTIIENLRRLFGKGKHPDVEALVLLLDPSGGGYRFEVPPLLRRSWALVVDTSTEHPDLVPADALAARVADRIWGEEPWLLWSTPAGEEEVGKRQDLNDFEYALKNQLMARLTKSPHARSTLAARTASKAMSTSKLGEERAGGESAAVAFSWGEDPAATASAVTPDLLKGLVRTLGIPRANVEKLFAKLQSAPAGGAKSSTMISPVRGITDGGSGSVSTPASLIAADLQAVLERAKKTSGQPSGPFPSPEDWRDLPIYFLMVDRFNNRSAPPRHLPFDDPSFSDYQGGKFSGVQEQLPYIKRLGAGTIWLSPVLKNLPFDPSYHGYGIHDFLRAEPRFADDPSKADEELRALVDAAHAQGLYVIFDIVLNHTGDVFAYQCEPNDKTCNDNRGAVASFHDKAQPIRWRDHQRIAQPGLEIIEKIPVSQRSRNALIWPSELQQNKFFRCQGLMGGGNDDTIGDFSVLKQMLTVDRDLQRVLIRAYQYVIARFDVDGFRIDTLRYLKGGLAQTFGNAVREFALSIGKKNFFTFGEVLDSRAEEDIARFIGRNTNDQGDLVGVDAALDYPLFFTLKPVVKGQAAPSTLVDMYHRRKLVEQDILSSHGDATRFFVTFLDNHDMKERIRYVDPKDEHLYDDQVTLGLTCLYALPGIPCLYYGTEQGLHGHGSDEAVREALWGGPGFDTGSFFYRPIEKLAKVRGERPALRYGRFYFRPVSSARDSTTFGITTFQQGVLAFSRILNDEEVLVVANTNTAKGQDQSVDVIVDNELNPVGVKFQILYSNKTLPTAPGAVQQTGVVVVHEVDGSIGNGPVHVVRVTLQPMEVQILSPLTSE
jgi:glycosidase